MEWLISSTPSTASKKWEDNSKKEQKSTTLILTRMRNPRTRFQDRKLSKKRRWYRKPLLKRLFRKWWRVGLRVLRKIMRLFCRNTKNPLSRSNLKNKIKMSSEEKKLRLKKRECKAAKSPPGMKRSMREHWFWWLLRESSNSSTQFLNFKQQIKKRLLEKKKKRMSNILKWYRIPEITPTLPIKILSKNCKTNNPNGKSSTLTKTTRVKSTATATSK